MACKWGNNCFSKNNPPRMKKNANGNLNYYDRHIDVVPFMNQNLYYEIFGTDTGGEPTRGFFNNLSKRNVKIQTPIGTIYAHPCAYRQYEELFKEWSQKNLWKYIKRYNGSLSIRLKRGGTTWSRHSWTTAFDFNFENTTGYNALGARPQGLIQLPNEQQNLEPNLNAPWTNIPLVESATRWGFRWGGWGLNANHSTWDGMHFEVSKIWDGSESGIDLNNCKGPGTVAVSGNRGGQPFGGTFDESTRTEEEVTPSGFIDVEEGDVPEYERESESSFFPETGGGTNQSQVRPNPRNVNQPDFSNYRTQRFGNNNNSILETNETEFEPQDPRLKTKAVSDGSQKAEDSSLQKQQEKDENKKKEPLNFNGTDRTLFASWVYNTENRDDTGIAFRGSMSYQYSSDNLV